MPQTTPEQRKFIMDNYKTMDWQEIADHLQIPLTTISFVVNRCKPRKFNVIWQPWELDFIAEKIPTTSVAEISKQLDRPEYLVKLKIRRERLMRHKHLHPYGIKPHEAIYLYIKQKTGHNPQQVALDISVPVGSARKLMAQLHTKKFNWIITEGEHVICSSSNLEQVKPSDCRMMITLYRPYVKKSLRSNQN